MVTGRQQKKADPSNHLHDWSDWRPESRELAVHTSNDEWSYQSCTVNVRYCQLPKCNLTQERRADKV